MGKEWYWSWSFRKGGSGVEREKQHITGCMGGMFHLLDLQRLLFTTTPETTCSPASKSENALRHAEILKGVEAPRNSLELDVTTTSLAAFVADDYEIPFGIQVVVPKRKTSLEEEEEERSQQGSSSSSARTGNVVAKLMGLDAFPDSSLSPRTNCYKQHEALLSPLATRALSHEKQKRRIKQKSMDCSSRRVSSQTPPPRHPLQPRNENLITVDDYDARRGTRSLPETPRVSFARRSWDSDPRLSVHSNKENVNTNLNMNMTELKWISEEVTTPSSLSSSPPVLLPMKVKSKERRPQPQVEEDRSSPSHYAKEIVKQMKDSVSRRRNKASETSPTTKLPAKSTLSSSSPRPIKEAETEHRRVVPTSKKHVVSQKPTPKSQTKSTPPPSKCKKWSCDRYTEKLKKPPSTAVTDAASRSRRESPLISTSPTKRTSKAQLQPIHVIPSQKGNSVVTTPVVPEQLNYVKRILERVGVRTHTCLPFGVRWNSPSHPLDPIIFHHLELTATFFHHSGPTKHRCNRRLLFDLVDEILGDLLFPYISHHPLRRLDNHDLDGDRLLLDVWSQIRTFPAANCQGMEDIDVLVGLDLPTANVRKLMLHPAAVEEAENVAGEVAMWLVDDLVDDTTAALLES